MFELKLGITLLVVGFIVAKIIANFYTKREVILVEYRMVDDEEYPTYKSIVLLLSYVAQFVGLVYIFIALWKLL